MRFWYALVTAAIRPRLLVNHVLVSLVWRDHGRASCGHRLQRARVRRVLSICAGKSRFGGETIVGPAGMTRNAVVTFIVYHACTYITCTYCFAVKMFSNTSRGHRFPGGCPVERKTTVETKNESRRDETRRRYKIIVGCESNPRTWIIAFENTILRMKTYNSRTKYKMYTSSELKG